MKTVKPEILVWIVSLRMSGIKGSVKPDSSEVYCTVNGRRYSVKNGENAVAFELRRGAADGDLLYFFNMYGYDIPGGIDLADAKLYAVQADGRRVEIPVR